eukprot:155535-Pelagomonas_calceolata.AAC.2
MAGWDDVSFHRKAVLNPLQGCAALQEAHEFKIPKYSMLGKSPNSGSFNLTITSQSGGRFIAVAS